MTQEKSSKDISINKLKAAAKKNKELYGKKLGDIRDKNDREQIFLDFVDELVAQGKSYDDARNEFEKYFY